MELEEAINIFELRDWKLYWKISLSNGIKVGDEAGSIFPKGRTFYRGVNIRREVTYHIA